MYGLCALIYYIYGKHFHENFADLFFSLIVSKRDPNYEATRLHFENLVKRYGNPIIVLNLIKVGPLHLFTECLYGI